MNPTRDEDTLRFYADGAAEYVTNPAGCVSPHLDSFLQRLRPGARILELGCGAGRDAEVMLGLGFDVEPTDGVAAIARQAELRLGRPVRVMSFDELDATEAYDAVWANASLLHVPREGLGQVLSRVHRALRPGGLHFASYKAGGVEGRDPHGRYFNYPSREQMLAAYADCQWRVEEVVQQFGAGYGGVQASWLAVTLRKA